MRSYPFMQVDAFTDQPLCGNPCVIVFDADDLDETTMQAIARENNLSETSFVMRSKQCDFRVRYFTPMDEVPMAGHPTIATTHALVETGRVKLTGPTTRITLQMQVGPITVEITNPDKVGSGSGPRVTMNQLKPRFLTVHGPKVICPFFGIKPDDLLPGAPIQTVSTGTPQLFIMMKDHDALRRARMPNDSHAPAMRAMDFFSCHLVTLGGATPRGRTFARHFARPPGAFEDPFTGSSTGGMAAYLWHHGLIDEPGFVAEQGHWMNRPGEANVEVVGPRDDIKVVRVTGTACTVIHGTLSLP